MARIGIVVGNGLTIDYCRTWTPQVLPDPSDPFQWEFDVPGEGGLNWRAAFPILKQSIDSSGGRVHSFQAFRSLLADVKSRSRSYSLRLDAEARQFLAFAYSVFQEKIDQLGVGDWHWRNWLAEHSTLIGGAVSFNYDRLFESAAGSAGLRLVPYAVGSRSTDLFFLKPHGSIDFEGDRRAISMPISTYPLRIIATLNDVPLVALGPMALRQPRQEAFIVLPAETSPYLRYQWVAPGYETWKIMARNLTHCVFVGLSYWQCDRQEIDFLLDALGPDTRVIVANPEPPGELMARISMSGRRGIEWRNGPQSIESVA